MILSKKNPVMQTTVSNILTWNNSLSVKSAAEHGCSVNREYVQNVTVDLYQKISNEVGRIDNFQLSFLQTELDIFIYGNTMYTYSIYLSTSDLLSFIISNTGKHEFCSIWKWRSCCNDVMNHANCVIKRDVCPHSCTKNIRGMVSNHPDKYFWVVWC